MRGSGCVRACMRAPGCDRALACACVRACVVRAFACVRACACVRLCLLVCLLRACVRTWVCVLVCACRRACVRACRRAWRVRRCVLACFRGCFGGWVGGGGLVWVRVCVRAFASQCGPHRDPACQRVVGSDPRCLYPARARNTRAVRVGGGMRPNKASVRLGLLACVPARARGRACRRMGLETCLPSAAVRHRASVRATPKLAPCTKEHT